MSYRKYGNQRTGKYMSKKEADIAQKLHILAGAGKIQDLREQVALILVAPFELNGKKYRGIKWVADFVWNEDGKTIWADAKGCKTAVYLLKRTLVAAIHKIEILEL
jgi:hypothetical protein